MLMRYPMMLDGGQPVGDVLTLLQDPDAATGAGIVLVRQTHRLEVVWYVAGAQQLLAACQQAPSGDSLAAAMHAVPPRAGSDTAWPVARRVEVSPGDDWRTNGAEWRVAFAGSRLVGVLPPQHETAAMMDPPSVAAEPHPPAAIAPPMQAPAAPAAGALPAPRGPTRGRKRPPADDAPDTVGAEPAMAGSAPDIAGSAPNAPATTDSLLAVARVDAPAAIAPSATASGTLRIGLAPAPSPTDEGVMRFDSTTSETQLGIDVMVEAPDFTCRTGWKHRLTVEKSDPFAATLTLDLVPLAPTDRTARTALVRVHYSYRGQPAGVAMRVIALGDATDDEVATIAPPRTASLTIAPSAATVDLTIRISRRDASASARELIWTLVDCAHPAITLPDAPLVQKVGDRDNASSFASKVTNQVNAADGTVMVDTMLRSIGTLIRRAIPDEVLTTLQVLRAVVGPARLPRVLLLTDECHVPWELAFLDAAPDITRAPYLGAQFAISRWIHGEDDIAVPPPSTLSVRDLAIVLGSYDASSLAPLPHAKEETTALTAESTTAPARFPRVTSVAATADAIVDLLDGTVMAATGTVAPQMVHFACHGEVLGTGVAKRSVLYLNDGSPLQDTLFIASALGRSAKSFIFMNACQVGVGGEELGQYAGFAGYAIAAGFSGFIGPLWSVNDEVAKRIAVDFYRRCFGTDGTASRPVGDVLADMRNQYLSEPDPKKRQSTWLAYVHYGHPHFTLTHAQ